MIVGCRGGMGPRQFGPVWAVAAAVAVPLLINACGPPAVSSSSETPAEVAAETAPAAAGDRPGDARADRIRITLDPAARDDVATGRVIVFFAGESAGPRPRRAPARGPFWNPPQPIASVAVTDLAPGATVVIDGATIAFPGSIDALHGSYAVQAVLDADDTERSHLDGPGNCLSSVREVTFDRGRVDEIELTLTDPVAPTERRTAPNLEWIELRSERLSQFYGRDVYHRAGVALPPAALDPGTAARRWPAVYVVPGFGGRDTRAAVYADMLSRDGIEEIAPMAVHVVLDPESPIGHHGFMDSPNHGPRGTALVTELIPYLEARFPLASRPAARVITGHSSGGWTSLWLALEHPDVFGACWSSAPDPIDFSAFQRTDLYTEPNLYVDADGNDVASYRTTSGRGAARAVMSVRQECLMEHAMHPEGRSGQQWDTWEAMFSPSLDGTHAAGRFRARPAPMFDAMTGRIDRAVVEHWSQFDITRRVTNEWDRLGPVVMERIRLSCGEEDSFYLERAVMRFKERVESLAHDGGGWTGPGYVNLVPDATHSSLVNLIFQRVNREMRDHFRRHDLAVAGE